MNNMETLKKYVHFIMEFFLTHCIWLVPTFILIAKFNTFLFIFLIPILVTLMYTSWKKKNEEDKNLQECAISRFPKGISFLYNISIFIFLILTGLATYEGIIKVFGLEGGREKFFAVAFAVGIPLTLFGITLIVKFRKTPMLIFSAFILYCLFDGLTALPFNFLFFYDNLTKSVNIQEDNNRFNNVLDTCNKVIEFGLQKAVNDTDKIDQIRKINKEYAEKKANDKMASIKQIQKQNISLGYKTNDGVKRETFKSKDLTATQNEDLRDARNRFMKFNTYKNKLIDCRGLKSEFDNASNLMQKTDKSNKLKNTLYDICDNFVELKSYSKELRPYIPSSIQSIKQFYQWIGENLGLIANNSNEDEKVKEERKMLTAISLTTSIVIDILPLLFSLLFVMYKRND